MNAIISQQLPATEAEAARARTCPLCLSLPGTPCQAEPPGDHLARYLDSYTAGRLSLAYMAEVLGELVVITHSQIIPAGGSSPDCAHLHSHQGPGCPWCAAGGAR